MRTPPARPSPGIDVRLKRRLIALLAAAVLVLAVLRAVDLGDRRRVQLQRTERSAGALVKVVGAFLRESFLSVDLSLRETEAFALRNPGDEEWQRFLEAQRASLGLGSISITDAAGIIRHSSLPGLVGQDRRDEPIFARAARDPVEGLISGSRLASLRDRDVILLPVGRRLSDPRGGFAGVVVATMPVARLEGFLHDFDIGARGALTVFAEDGRVLLREPGATSAPEARRTLYDLAGHAPSPEPHRGPIEPGGGEKFTAFLRVASPPLLVALSLDREAALADWRRAAWISAGIVAVVAILLAAGLSIVLREAGARRLAQLGQDELQHYIDSMSTMSAKVAPDGRLLMVNRIGALASGLPPEELLGSDLRQGKWFTYDPEVASRVQEAFDRALAGETVTYEERLFIFGAPLDVSFSLAPVRDASDRIEYLVAEARDISSLVGSQRELSRRTQELEAAYAELEAFSYSVSHDLRAPLRAITGFAEVLDEESGHLLDDEGRRLLRIIGGNAAHLGALIDDLLRFSRFGRVGLALAPVDMTALAASVIRELDAASVCRIDGDLPACFADEAMFRQVWINLVSNAVKFSRQAPAPRVEIAGSTRDGESCYTVRDNGVGFDMAHARNLFGVFERLHAATEFEGTGVGLAIVKRVVERHHGRVWASSAPGAGATFTFTVPDRPRALG